MLMNGATMWDARWSLHAPATATASGAGSSSNYASWKRRVQALLEVESVWEVVSESVVFDDAWPLTKQLEFVQKDKLGMHLILSTVHDSVVALFDSGAGACNRSWLMLQRLDRVFAAHRMQSVRQARRAFLALQFPEPDATNTSSSLSADATAATTDTSADDPDAMLHFIERVQSKGDELARLRGSNGSKSTVVGSSSHDDELMYQLLDALPPSWVNFVALECETDAALTWTTAKRKVLAEYAKRCASRALGRSDDNPTMASVKSDATAGAPPTSSGASSISSVAQLDAEPLPLEQRPGGGDLGVSAGAEGVRANRPSSAKLVIDVNDEVDLRSPMDGDDDEEEEDDETFGMVDDLQQQQEPKDQEHETLYYDHQHAARPKYSSTTSPLARHRRDMAALLRPTPYARPTMTASGEKICFYCSTPGHLAHLCPLKRMHWEARKKASASSSSGYRHHHHHHHHSAPSQQQ